MPSVVSFRPDGGVLVGLPAKSAQLLNPANTVTLAKRFIGDGKKTYRMGGRLLTPVDISRIILQRLVEGAQDYLGEPVRDAVITVPAYFNEVQRAATKRAGEEAGLRLLRLIPEPTAAAIAYGLDQGRNQLILVYDMGGGTFDVSLLRVRHNHFEVLAVGGDNRLGGDDIDQALLRWVAERFHAATGLDLLNFTTDESLIARQRLKKAVEAAKIELSHNDKASIILANCLGHPLAVDINQSIFRALIAPLLEKTVYVMRQVVRDAGVCAADIDRVILVGGSTKIRVVRELIAQEVREPYITTQAEAAVAHGAAMMATSLFLSEAGDTVPVRISNVTGHSLGVDMLDEHDELIFQTLIPRQTRYPCKRGHLGFTQRPLQDKVVMTVYRGEQRRPQENCYLGRLTLPVAPPQPDNVPIGVIFELDADGIIHFTAIQLPTNLKSRSITDYAHEHNGALDIAAVQTLLKSGDARAKTIRIKSE